MADSNNKKGRRGEEEKRRHAARKFILHPSSFILRRPAFTLLEVLVALIIFGIITLALSTAMSSALHAKVLAEQRQEQNETVRGIFATMTRDLQAAYGSINDPNALFVGSSTGGQSGSTNNSSSQALSSGALLTLSTLSNRITTTDPNVDPTVNSAASGQTSTFGSSANSSSDPPQQAVGLVRYDLDTSTGTLTRIALNVPALQTLEQATPAPENVIGQHILSLTLQYYDPNQQTMRDDWDFEQPNLPPASSITVNTTQTGTTLTAGGTSTSSASSSSTGTTGSAAQSGSTVSAGTGTGDVGLPSAVQVTLVIQRADGAPVTYTTTIPILTYRLQDYPFPGGQATDPNAATQTGATQSGQ